MAKVKIDTTQNVRLEYEPASVGDRIIATLIDALIIYGFVITCILLLFQVRKSLDQDLFIILVFVALFPIIFYHLLSEILLNGQSIGKRARNIKILKLDGTEPTLSSYLLRWLIRPIDLLFYGFVAIITISANARGQRLGDLVAGTTVVKLNPPVTLDELLVFAQDADLYQPTYWQVTLLGEKDIQTIQAALDKFRYQKTSAVIERLADKVKAHLQIQTQEHATAFLKTIVKDYMHLSSQE